MKKSDSVVEKDIALQIGEVAFSYYQVQRAAPDQEDFLEWIGSLPEPARSRYLAKGFAASRNDLAFLDFFRQIRDREMKMYMQERLSKEDYLLWLTHRHRPSEE
ncbi:hypothetical protein [Cesiribacter andamanensis]|uniref:Uncharacterized protein n=1 Tax=Cesiribacter andamanensis AMV16 TaxID=1279009 RepID=M7N7W1_9BACT|nr:hypothetical protein [Cesiribacter andamanensis]EMR04693.1 hypothetical protein ADICEAN_00145 [Cesiribacter andamanensis AMV16]